MCSVERASPYGPKNEGGEETMALTQLQKETLNILIRVLDAMFRMALSEGCPRKDILKALADYVELESIIVK